MADQLYIVNQALAHLGQDATDTIDPADAREVVRKVLSHADAARDAVLSAHPWLAALVYATLTVDDGDNSNWRYGYRYTLPSDGLQVFIVNSCEKWEQGVVRSEGGAETKVIWSDQPATLQVAYTQRIAWTSMASSLADAVGYELAARAALPVTQDAQVAGAVRQMAQAALRKAQGRDGVQQGGQAPLFPGNLAAARRAAG